MFVAKGTPTPGVPLVSLYPDFDKKATAFFVEVYVLFAHSAAKRAGTEEFVNSAGNSDGFAGKIDGFCPLDKGSYPSCYRENFSTAGAKLRW